MFARSPKGGRERRAPGVRLVGTAADLPSDMHGLTDMTREATAPPFFPKARSPDPSRATARLLALKRATGSDVTGYYSTTTLPFITKMSPGKVQKGE